ncbi:MAG: hypothetical protein HC906_17290 [Bacteroidales bacterium]|nr:hypothetical protein [Bacteroidales bacterium]
MKTSLIYFFALLMFILPSCKQVEHSNKKDKDMGVIQEQKIYDVIDSLLQKYGEDQQFRIERGVNQVAKFWKKEDGDENGFGDFCITNFIADSMALGEFFTKIERNMELLTGNYARLILQLKEPLELEMGKITPADMLFASFNPASHLEDDLFKNQIAFHILLNFPFYSLQEKADKGDQWSRKEWAYARAADLFTSRVPSENLQEYSDISTKTDAYIAEYNIVMGNLLAESGETLFPKGMNLITHWGLRDELKSNYSVQNGLKKQQMIYTVMNRIINQDIPAEVINNENVLWKPESNVVIKDGEIIKSEAEGLERYQHLLDILGHHKKLTHTIPITQLPF